MQQIYNYITKKEHLKFRHELDQKTVEKIWALSSDPYEWTVRRFEIMCEGETPVILPEEKICITRTVGKIPDIFTKEERNSLYPGFAFPEGAHVSNFCPDYARLMKLGLVKIRETADTYGKREIDALLKLIKRYENEARRSGNTELADILNNVPANPPRTFSEALQFCRIIHFACYLDKNHHVTVGRFDKYMYPYYKADTDSGRLDKQQAYELVREFFLSFNKDSDTYSMVQLGDNGQSLVLGGDDGNGGEIYNDLTEFALRASKENMLIDPKINLRVSSKTPTWVFEKGTELTKAGLGFPQYCNDDIVIPALIELGYDKEDAKDYVTAACWEFIIPGKGFDIPNIKVMQFAKVIDDAVHLDLPDCHSFEQFKSCVKSRIFTRAAEIDQQLQKIHYYPAPFADIVLNEKDCSKGGRYNNFGIHGSGVATAADSMAAIEKCVFNEHSLTSSELISAIDSDFEGCEELLHKLRYETAKMGQNDSDADDMGIFLLDSFADALKGKTNSRGGIYRAGTGTAMYYLRDVEDLPASPDGRRRGEPLGTNFSPSLFAKIDGPMSVIKSFTKPDLKRTCNGGPLTLEFHAGIFDSDESVKKVSALVKAFIQLGGHQLQLNAVNLEALKKAQVNPQDYKNLIVRIWGWSAYFTELDKPYQDHVISRQEYSI